MPRKPRIHYTGALYHVICRGNNREWIFRNDSEKLEYIDLIKEYKQRYGFKLYAWVLMSNHAHLLIEVGDVPLSKIMQGIQQGYTQWYNGSHRHSGHVFEQRYKATHCNKDLYLLALIRYIHQNPSRAKIENGIEYPWSSHKDYISGIRDSITDTAFPLQMFSEDSAKALASYMDFMDEDEETIGTLKAGEYEEGTQDHEPPSSSRNIIKNSLQELIEMTALEYDINVHDLYGKSKFRQASSARKALILVCVEHSPISIREIAQELKISDTAVSKMIVRGLEDQRERKERIIGRISEG